jgi:hypothetical protein
MSAFVEEAAEKASWLVRREMRGTGDLHNAMRRIETRFGIPYGALWSLRYRRPGDMLVSIYARICVAYEAEVEKQRNLLDANSQSQKQRPGLARLWIARLIAWARRTMRL